MSRASRGTFHKLPASLLAVFALAACCTQAIYAQDAASLAAEAASLSQSGQYRLAKDKFSQAVSVSPANATLHLSLGLTCQRLGELEQAAASLQQAASLNPSLVQAHYSLALVCEALAIKYPAQKASYLSQAKNAWQAVLLNTPPQGEQAQTAKKHLAALQLNGQ